jgi:hypothetical protein
MGSEGMAKGMTPDPFDDVRFEDLFFNVTRQKGLMDVLSAIIPWHPWHTP